jgi:hypothetical protein
MKQELKNWNMVRDYIRQSIKIHAGMNLKISFVCINGKFSFYSLEHLSNNDLCNFDDSGLGFEFQASELNYIQ